MAYKMTHPDSDETRDVRADMVEMHETQGWETAKTAKSPAKPDEK